MRNILLLAAFTLLCPALSLSQTYSFSENIDKQGFILNSSDTHHTGLSFSIASWSLEDISINRQAMQKVVLPGHFLPNDEGMPDLPGSGRFIAIPQGATASLEITNMETETLQGINVSPAPRIPKTTEDGPLFYSFNESVYSANAFYPAEPVKLSDPKQIRGVDVVMLGITPFQYNPVTKELIIIKNIEIEVTFTGGNGHFGDDRLRSRWWEPLMADMLLNYNDIDPIDYMSRRSEVGFEYLIICPDDPDFLAWADTIRMFRNKQGILTGIVTTAEIGGNTTSAIENYINTAYNSWDIPPAAILILGDYGSEGATVISPIWDNYCASDNIYGDVNNDDLPDIVMARIFAQDASQLEIMIGKIIDHEINPPVDPGYYAKPVTALGWQTERWFQVCIETVGGFFRNVLGKQPVRVNAVYDGDPNVDPWSTAPNTSTVLNYFGPNGLGYLPATPSELGMWYGGTSNKINTALNNGSFLLLHRDHGNEQGWGEPGYTTTSMSGLYNEMTTMVYSVNCLTGKFNIGGECFAESFLRYPKRAYGIIAASEVSYSFVNDTYVWGAFDNMWPEFMPDYGTTPGSRGLLPAFSNAAGKFFLEQSSWPYNTDNKEVTYNLFHYFGDALTTMYSEVPEEILVLHNNMLIGGADIFTVDAENQSFIALSVNGEIIGTADGTGSPVDVEIIPQDPGTVVDIVVTKTNHFRYENHIGVISPETPFIVYKSHLIGDQGGNGNGLPDYHENFAIDLDVQNIGLVNAENVSVTLSSDDPYALVIDSVSDAGTIPAGAVITASGFSCRLADSVPDGYPVIFSLKADDGNQVWNSQFYMTACAPSFKISSYNIIDDQGNDDGKLDPGETADLHIFIKNTGTSEAYDVKAGLSGFGPFLTVLSGEQDAGSIGPGAGSEVVFTVQAGEETPGGLEISVNVNIHSDFDRTQDESISFVVGDYSALVLDLDPMRNSGPAFIQAFNELGFCADYQTVMPADLSSYNMVFVCLGIYFTNHILTSSEAQKLKAFLDQGGNLYMEGRLTWYQDPQTILQPMFNINSKFTNFYRIDTVYGFSGTFGDGMQFSYQMTQPYNNHQIHAIPPAVEVMKLLPDSLPSMVAYEAPGYKTIGSNTEFGGLVESVYPSARKELLLRILQFFGQNLTGTEFEPISPANESLVTVYPNPFTDEVRFRFELKEPSEVVLEIYDLSGRVVEKIINTKLNKGEYVYAWKTDNYNQGKTNGIYFYRFINGMENQGGKLLFIE